MTTSQAPSVCSKSQTDVHPMHLTSPAPESQTEYVTEHAVTASRQRGTALCGGLLYQGPESFQQRLLRRGGRDFKVIQDTQSPLILPSFQSKLFIVQAIDKSVSPAQHQVHRTEPEYKSVRCSPCQLRQTIEIYSGITPWLKIKSGLGCQYCNEHSSKSTFYRKTFIPHIYHSRKHLPS